MRRTLILDVNDILFSTQYLFLHNINRVLEHEEKHKAKEDFDKVKQALMIKGKSFFQSIAHREIEEIVSPVEFFDIMKFGEFKERLEEGIRMFTPYSRYMINLDKMLIESDIICVYKDDVEQFLLNHRILELDTAFISAMSVDDLKVKLSGSIKREEIALFTSDTKLIEEYHEKIDIMIPDTLAYLKKYHEYENIFPLTGLWTHIK